MGVFSLALGTAELFGSRKVADTLDADGHKRLVKGVGACEAAAGLGILMQPEVSRGIWNRVAGDAMNRTTLRLAAKGSPRNKAVWGSLAFVAGITVLDSLVARGLDAQTGKAPPMREHLQAA